MSKKKLFAGLGGLAVVLIVVLLIFSMADRPAFNSLLGYSGPPVSGEGAIAYMTVSSNHQGQIKGDVTEAGREDMHAIFEIEHRVMVPVDPNTNQVTGTRRHEAFQVTTHLSPGAPNLYEMCTRGEMGTVTIQYWRKNAQGQQEHYYTVKLEDAHIVDLFHYKPMALIPDNEPYGDMLNISFLYGKITWTHEIDGIETNDSWNLYR